MLVPPLPGNIEHSTVTRLDSSTMSRIDLISLSHSAADPDWTLGAVSVVTPLTGAVADALANTQGDVVPRLDGRLPLPDAALSTSLLEEFSRCVARRAPPRIGQPVPRARPRATAVDAHCSHAR